MAQLTPQRPTGQPNSSGPSSQLMIEVPDFTLIRPIGSGSYGEVWLAQSIIGAYRAIKIVRRSQFDSERSFEREFRGIRSFEPVSRAHRNLLQVLHVGRNEDDGFYFYVMELADDASGLPISDPQTYAPKTLRSIARTGDRLPASEVVQIGRALASGLSHLHGLGLVHRDIKPSNIVFVNGLAKLGDAGLVASPQEDMSLVGTAGYVPPEGMGKPQADIYSLGMVIYEISTGKPRQDFPEMPTDLPTRDDKPILMQINDIALKACDPNPAHRFKTASRLLANLDRIQLDQNSVDEKKNPFVRHKVMGAAILTVLLISLFIFLMVIRLKKQPDNSLVHQPIIDVPVPQARPTEEQSPSLKSDARLTAPKNERPQIQEPVEIKTIATENAGDFLQP